MHMAILGHSHDDCERMVNGAGGPRGTAMKLAWINGQFGVATLPPSADIPAWASGPGFCAIIRSDDELTLVCQADRIPKDVTSEKGWACFRSIGPFAFDQAGVVAALIGPISAANIGVFVVCTFDGEHIMVPQTRRDDVTGILTTAGHQFVPA